MVAPSLVAPTLMVQCPSGQYDRLALLKKRRAKISNKTLIDGEG